MRPTSPSDGDTSAASRGRRAVEWLSKELSEDGGGRILPVIGSGLSFLAYIALAVLALGVAAALLAGLAFCSHVAVLAAMLLLCAPAIVAPLVAWRSLVKLRESVTHPREIASQLHDLISGLGGSPELRELATRLKERAGMEGTIAVRGGRLRRSLHTARLLSKVVGIAQPDPVRHRLLIPFTPERTGRMLTSFTWSAWGAVLATIVWFSAFTSILLALL
ncbi:MAG: hypothetical protein KDB02_15665 [Acidimicrobiales bacterium]|nr:hypothetical protein [Acidimicrobiales bacterium]